MPERINHSENQNLLSLDRAKRGAKIGAFTGVGLATSLLILTAISAGINKPELLVNNFKEFTEVAAILELGAITTLASVGAFVDGLKPISRMVERKIAKETETFQSIKGGISAAWKLIRQPGSMDVITENKGEITRKLLLLGGLGTASLFGFKALKDIYRPILDNLFDEAIKHPSNLPDYLSNHCTEVAMGIGTVFTLAGIKSCLSKAENRKARNKDSNI